MNPQRSFVRKIVYLVLIAVLLVPMYLLSRPAVIDPTGAADDPGGLLAQLRKEHHLSQTSLGEIDPASETMRLATFGLRCVAANILWEKANEYKKKKDWTNLSATCEQIAKIEPNFVSVWRFQAWNQSYNCSAEFDDYRERYRWVLKGINYLLKGIEYNSREPILQWDVGWFISHKIGRSDEKKQFRRLFKADDQFLPNRSPDERDNWLVGREWFQEVERMVATQGVKVRGVSPLIHHSDGPMCLMNYADTLEQDGVFGDAAKRAWRNAAADWERYGDVEIPLTAERKLCLGDQEMYEQRAKKLRAELDALEPGLREKLAAAKRAKLTDAQRQALAVPDEQRTPGQADVAREAQERIHVTHAEVAQKITGAQQKRAQELAEEIAGAETMAIDISRDRGVVNYDYWRLRAQVEQEDDTIRARSLIYAGERAFAEARLSSAREAYDQGLAAWRKVLDKHPPLRDDKLTSDELMDVIKQYRELLKQLDVPFPKDPNDFILSDVLKAHAEN